GGSDKGEGEEEEMEEEEEFSDESAPSEEERQSSMIDLCQWRARIGSWNCTHQWTQPSSRSTGNNNSCGTNGAAGSGSNTAQGKTPRLALSIFCLLILLFISGDVELNPGPTLT
uniref:Uncharacterized protein n=1 Tax=Amphimedon queenslandica TaxID=400682 RepID=A0A1X7SHU6_AMPQE